VGETVLTPPSAPNPAGPLSSAQAGPAGAGRVLPASKADAWRRRVTAALESTKESIEDGKTNVARYTGKYLSTTPKDDECLVPTDFYFAETKRSRLFFRLPDVFVKPEQPGLEDAAVVFQAALNKKLGPKGVNVLPTVKQIIMDLLVGTGFGGVAIGCETIVGEPAQVPVPMPDGTVMLGPNIVASYLFVEHVKPGDLLVAPEFVGTDFDKAPWVGQRFKEDVPDEDESGGSDANPDDRRLTPLPQGAQSALRKQRTGYEIWYRARLFDPDVKHPDKIRTFKLYDDDKEAPVELRDHPHQRYANPAGKLKAGMRGYGVKVCTLRYTPDTWLTQSDASMARNTADELSKGRTQMLRSRDRNTPQWGYDSTRVDKDIQGKIEKNEIQGGIPFNGPGQDATWPIQKGTAPKETYSFDEVAKRDLERIWRLGSNQMGVTDDKVRTASEQQITASASQESDEADRSVFAEWFVDKIASEFAALMQLYCGEQEYVELLGADAQRLKAIPPEVQQQAKQAGQDARVLVPWNSDAIQGLYSFSIKPNSQAYVDAAQEAKMLSNDYQFLANSPNINKAEFERQYLQRRGYDTSKLMQQPPPKEAAAPNVSLTVKGEDFNPQMPQAPILLDALSKLGVPIDMTALQTAIAKAEQLTADAITAEGLAETHPQTEHGGAVAKAEPLSKHQTEQTGGMQGSGAPAPMGAGGLR
jgi:hypothetical protein